MRLPTALMLAAAVVQAGPPDATKSDRVEITLEREKAGEWHVIDPGLVLDQDDRVRFRFRANFDGYLYVMNQGTSGKTELLFPREETGEENRIEAGKEYRIPATQAWFRVAGPPGHDVVYWLVTPLRLGGESTAPQYVPLPPPPKGPAAPQNLSPRCDDSIFRARGICVDSGAGPRQVNKADELPENLSGVPNLRSRELVIMRKGDESLISSPATEAGPVLYQFRLAHR